MTNSQNNEKNRAEDIAPDTKISAESAESAHDTNESGFEFAIPLSEEERRNKPHSTSVIENDDEDFFAIPLRTRQEKDNAFQTKVMDSDKDDADDFIFTRYHSAHSKHKHHNTHSTEGTESPVRSKSEQHHRYNSHRKKMKFRDKTTGQKIRTILLYILIAFLILALSAGGGLLLMVAVGNNQLTNYGDASMTAPELTGKDVSVLNSGKTIIYDGKEYAFNENMTSILCIGVDKREMGLEDDQVGTGGQADAIYMIALDTKTGETDVIAISRDIVTDIGIYSPDGEYLRTEKHQLCLSYAYGNGKDTSCLNTVTAVERLFYQLPIQSHIAIDLDAVAQLNDAIGGVTVTMIDDDFIDSNIIRHYKGETLTLYGDDARRYLQVRKTHELNSSVDRMDRQINYLKAFSKKALQMTKEDIGLPLDLYNIIENNSSTNLTPAKISAFATTIVTNGIQEMNFVTVPGTVQRGEKYAEYVVDETAFYEMFLDIYYNPVE